MWDRKPTNLQKTFIINKFRKRNGGEEGIASGTLSPLPHPQVYLGSTQVIPAIHRASSAA